MQYYLAVDIGASSGRHILGHVENGRMVLEEMYRFDNNLVEKNGHLCWDTAALFAHIVQGMKACGAAGKAPATMGIDTWAVDFVLLDGADAVLGDTVAYRDKRTEGMDAVVNAAISAEELYAKTGIQKQIFNTIYQLAAVQAAQPKLLKQAESLLMIPDYFNFLLTGVKKQEYTNASSTNLLNAADKTWDKTVLSALHLPQRLFCPLCVPGETVGPLCAEIAAEVGFTCSVILPATHDTGSAFLAVPARDENAVYISSGTWSLLGVENASPITTQASCAANFTNEGGYQYRYRYLKNIMGLWMIQSIRRNLDKKYSFAQLEEMAKECEDFKAIVDVNDADFLAPNSMIDAVAAHCKKTGQRVPQTIGETMQCVYQSLAASYAQAISQLQTLTGKRYTSINIVGGGSKDNYLNTLTAKATGLPVFAGPTEGTALGNLMVQFLAAQEYTNLQSARDAIKTSFTIKEMQP